MIFDVPRITTSTRDSVSGVNSAVIYNLDYNRFEYHDGSSWLTFLSGQNSNTVWSFNSRTGDIIFQDSDIASLGDFTASGVLTVTESILLGNSALKIGTINISPNISGVVANSGSLLLKNDGTLWTKDGSSNTDWSPVQPREYTNEPTGFTVGTDGEVDRSSSTIAFNNSTREFTISVTSGYSRYYVFIQGKLFTKTISQSVTLPNTTGSYYIYFDETGDLVYTSNFDLEIIFKYAYVSIIYWNSTQNKAVYFGDERHGCVMDGHTHARIHQVDGAVYINGSALTGFTIDGDGSSNAHTQFAISSGQIKDEDILHTLDSKDSTTTIPVLYRIGSEWRSVENANQKFHYNTRAYYNSVSDGSYGLTEVANNKFCLYHIVATNDKDNPYFSVMGLNQYDVKSTAREGALTEISQYAGLPFVEFVFIGTIIFESRDAFSNTGKSIIVSTDTGGNYIDWRFSKTLNPSTASVNIHNNLGGIQGGSAGDYYHSNQAINTTDSVTFSDLKVSNEFSLYGLYNNDGLTGDITSSIFTPQNSTFSIAVDSATTFHGIGWLGSTPQGKILLIRNTSASINIIIANQSVTETTASARIITGSGSNYILAPNASVLLFYDGATTRWKIVGQNRHNLFPDLQGGDGTNYYHSNQAINTTDSVAFDNIYIANDAIITGTLIAKGITYPTIDGTNGQALVTDGSGSLSFQTIEGGGGSSGGSSVTFTSSNDFPLGSPVYLSSSGTWQLSQANFDSTPVEYVISEKTGSGNISYTALASGEITLTTEQWDIVTNASGGLITGSTYFLSSNTAGKISRSVGLIYSPVLRALSSTKAFVSLSINQIESGMGDTFYRETTTTVGTTTSITLTYAPAGKAYTWLSIDGVLQSGNDFSLAGNTLTLGESVPSGTLIDILYARAILLADSNAINKMVAFEETITGSPKTTFNLPSAPSGISSCIVFVGGSIQPPNKFNISGNVLTFIDPIPLNVQLIVYILNSSGISNSIDSFVTRKTHSLPIDGTINIQTLFGNQITGLYRFFDSSDARISGTISVKNNGSGIEPDLRVDSNSSLISIAINTASKLNIYISSNLITFQNKTSSLLSLIIYRET